MSETANAPTNPPASDPENRSDGWVVYALILAGLALAGWGATVWHLMGDQRNRSSVESATVISHYHEVVPFPMEVATSPSELPMLQHGDHAFFLPEENALTDFGSDKMTPIGRDSTNRYFLFEHRDAAEGIGPNGEIILFVRDANRRFLKVQTRLEEIE